MFPTLFSIGNFEITTFGVMMLVAFFVGGTLTGRLFERAGLTRDQAWQLVTWAMIGGVAGSKLWYVAEFAARRPGEPWLDALLSRGGITWYGGLVGGAVAVLAVARFSRPRLDLRVVMDAAAPAIAIGQALGRVGCFLVGDDWGRPTDGWWGVAFPNGVDPIDVPVHPTQLYEVVWLSVAFVWLWRRVGRARFLFGEYLIWAGLGRLWIETLRVNPTLVGPFTNAQVTALVAVALGVGGILWMRARATAHS